MKRFPFGLTASAAVAFAILAGLGVWQLYRLAWKTQLLARVEALRAEPARPIADMLALAARGEDVEYRRVRARCAPSGVPAAPPAYRYALREGQVGWRLLGVCPLAEGPYDGVLVDRGLVAAFAGAMAPGAARFAPPAAVVGVLRAAGGRPLLGPAESAVQDGGVRVFRLIDRVSLASLAAQNGLKRPAPYLLAAEAEAPQPTGVTPAALPQDIPNNHFVYAMTWFALAAVLVCIYVAMLPRRLKAR